VDGLPVVERDEFGITVLASVDDAVGSVRTVTTGDGGSIGINLANRNLSYAGSTGLGFTDLLPVGLDYGYQSADASACAGYQGILGACGWSTNWDERFTAVASASGGAFIYQDGQGRRFQADTDPDGQITGPIPGQATRARVTIFDENYPSSAYASVMTASAAGLSGAPSGSLVLRMSNASLAGIGGAPSVDLGSYPLVAFAVRTNGNLSASLDFKIHDVQQNADQWFKYTLGTDWATGFPQKNVAGTIANTWMYVSRDMLRDFIGAAGFPAAWSANDTFQVTSVQHTAPSGGSGYVYYDAIRLEPLATTSIGDNLPSFVGGSASLNTRDYIVAGTGAPASVPVASANVAGSPDCSAACFNGGSAMALNVYYPFTHWWWKKVGGTTAAVVIHLKDTRSNATGDITYYAGPTPPAGASHAIQVTPALPTDWSRVTRNVLEDARQVLGFYNDAGDGSADPVSMTGFKLVGGDGNFLLVDDLSYASIPDAAGVDRWGHTDEYGLPNATYNGAGGQALPVVGLYDFRIDFPDGTSHFFNRDGLLVRIADRDGNATRLDWSVAGGAGTTQSSYTLTAIRGASDGSSSGGVTFSRSLSVATVAGTAGAPTTVTFGESVGGVATGQDASSRTAVFSVATAQTASGTTPAYNVGDLVSVSPARNWQGSGCTGTPSGCAVFGYADNAGHALSMVRDPRYSSSNQYAMSVTWDTSAGGSTAAPTAVLDLSRHSAPQLRVFRWSHNTDSAPAYTRPLYADAAALAKGYAMHVDLSPDGSQLAAYAPQPCTGGDCATNPPAGDSGALAGYLSETRTYDGLGNATSTVQYRCPSTALVVSGCAGTTALASISRSASGAAAKVDNYADALAATETAWTQTADQYFASMKDSGGTNPDLYRTEYAYNGHQQPVDTNVPVYNPAPDYPDAVKNTDFLRDYWRMDDSSAGTMADAVGGRNGAYTGSPALGGGGALQRQIGTSVAFNGSSQFGSVPAATIGAVTGSYTLESWIKPSTGSGATMATADAVLGSRTSSALTFDAKLCYDGTTCPTPSLRLDVGNGTAWLLSGNVPFKWQAGHWYDIVVSVDDSADTATVYVDGDLAGSLPFTTAGTPALTTAATALDIGQDGLGAEYFAGSVDEVALYTAALDPTKIRVHMLAGDGLADHHSVPSYDREGHVTALDDEFLVNAGFESGLAAWQSGNGAAPYFASAPGDASVNSGFASLNITGPAYVNQYVQLVPGQRFRVQFSAKTVGTGAHATFSLYYWSTTSNSWATLYSFYTLPTAWTPYAYDVALPTSGTDGRTLISLWDDNHVGTAYFDDTAIVTSWGTTTYGPTGLVTDAATMAPGVSTATGTIRTHLDYTPQVAGANLLPSILPTDRIADYQDGTPGPAPDQDVTTSTSYDAWGRTVGAVDADGVSTTTAYGTDQTDIASTTDALGNTSVSVPDQVGHQISYDAVDAVDAQGVDTHADYSDYGQRQDSVANYVAGGRATASQNVRTAYTYDALGNAVETDSDTAGVDAVATSAFDLLGDAVATTQKHGAGESDPDRTTSSRFETAGPYTIGGAQVTLTRAASTATVLPVAAAGGPACPDGSGDPCNSVASLDINGQAISSTDALGNVTLTNRDVAGRPVRVTANYVAGGSHGTNNDKNLVSLTVYDVLGRSVLTTKVVDGAAKDQYTKTFFDALGRSVDVISGTGSVTAVDYADAKTVYLPSGRVDRASSTEAVATPDSGRSWTKTLYDADGRAVETVSHYDVTGAAGTTLSTFEADADRWGPGATGLFLSAGATISRLARYGSVPALAGGGLGLLKVDTSGANSGASVALSTPPAGSRIGDYKQTFVHGHTYQLRVSVLADAGLSGSVRFGYDERRDPGALHRRRRLAHVHPDVGRLGILRPDGLRRRRGAARGRRHRPDPR